MSGAGFIRIPGTLTWHRARRVEGSIRVGLGVLPDFEPLCGAFTKRPRHALDTYQGSDLAPEPTPHSRCSNCDEGSS